MGTEMNRRRRGISHEIIVQNQREKFSCKAYWNRKLSESSSETVQNPELLTLSSCTQLSLRDTKWFLLNEDLILWISATHNDNLWFHLLNYFYLYNKISIRIMIMQLETAQRKTDSRYST